MDKQKNIDKFSILLKKWQSVINKMKTRDDDAFMKTGEKASADEIANLEMESGFKLPPSFSDAISGIGKSFDLSYSFYDYVLPDELGEIFSGRLSWDVSNFMSMYEYLGLIEYENNDDVEAKTYAEKMKNLCQFSCSGNGDVYVFDMSCEALEKSVLYWNHETDEITYLANSFGEYLEKITELYCVGNEIWQFEEFLDKNGLCPDSEKAQNWKKWFECFTTTELTDVAGNLDDLFQFAICRKNMDEQVIAALRLYGKALLFEKLKETLKEGVQRQEAACKMMALLIGDYAQEWLIYFWNNAEVSKVKHSTWLKLGDINILPALLSYLSANCMDKTMGAEYVKRFLEV
ncbi:MAG: SMI1/KNR4 family protein, partial [Syntrophorhabdaceae bacterium]|nr:SMI1/KNR4 family protein [Syntrophorhabdaceae bacterium]